MEQIYSTPTAHHPVRAVFGFIFTMLMTATLIAAGVLTGLLTSVLKGDNINDILTNTGFYDTLRTAVTDELSSEKFGLSSEAIASVLPDDIMSETIDKIMDSIVNDTAFDVSYLYDDCSDIAQTTSDKLVDEAFDMIDNNSVFDAKTLSSLPGIADFEENFGVDVTSEVENTMTSKFGSTSVDLSLLGTDEVKKQVSDTVSDAVSTVINEAFDKYTDTVNEIANSAIQRANDEYKIKDVLSNFDVTLEAIHIAVIVLYILFAVFFIIQLLMYLKKPSGAFTSLSVAALITAVIMFIFCSSTDFLADKIVINFNSFDSLQNIIKDFIETNINTAKSQFMLIGIICCIVTAVSTVIAIVARKAKR